MSKNQEFWNIKISDQPAFITAADEHISYRQLHEDIKELSTVLKSKPGPLALLCDGSYRQYTAYLSALNAGCPVLLMSADQDPQSSNITLKYAYSARDGVLRVMSDDNIAWNPELAVLLSTSGSTGAAKWVRLSFDNIAANACSIAEYLSLSKDDRAPMALPFQYSFGMSIVNSHLAVGATIVLIEGSVVDKEFWKTFAENRCTSFSGVPHSYELITQAQIPTDAFRHLRYMTQAGGRLGAENVENWVKRGQREGWDFFVMYGQTEASPRISYLPPHMALETPSAIGIPVPKGKMWVSNEKGEPLADGEEGELCYQGPNTMMGYASSDDDLLAPQGTNVLKTGDIAKRLPNGAFEIVGRMSRFVKLFGLRISLDEVEKRLAKRGLQGVCVARDDKMYVVLPEAEQDQLDTVAQDLSTWLSVPAASFGVTSIPDLPRQASGKVDLRAVTSYIEKIERESNNTSAEIDESKLGFFKALVKRKKKSVKDIYKEHFPKSRITGKTSFVDLGGDSLSYVAVSVKIETALGHLPDDWETMPIDMLQDRAINTKLYTFIDTPTLIRALSIMLIVAGHFNFISYGGGGALSLFVVAGISFASFTLPQLTSRGIRPIASLGARIALITFSYTALNYIATGYGELPAFLFFGNLVSPSVEGSAWFIEVYLQTLLFLGIIFSIPQVRTALVDHPFRYSAILAFTFVLVAAFFDYLFDTHHLFRRLPHLYAWFFFTGMAIGSARNNSSKLLVTGIFLAGLWQFEEYKNLGVSIAGYFPIAVLSLIWVPSLPIPRVSAGIIRSVTGASLLIYLSHFQFASVSKAIFGNIPALSWLLAIAGGTAAWKLYLMFEMFLKNRALVSANSSGKQKK